MIPGKGRRFDIVLDQNYMSTTLFFLGGGGKGGRGVAVRLYPFWACKLS